MSSLFLSPSPKNPRPVRRATALAALAGLAVLLIPAGSSAQNPSRFFETLPDSAPLRETARLRLKNYGWRLNLQAGRMARIYDAQPKDRARLEGILNSDRNPAYERWAALQKLAGFLRTAGEYEAAAALYKKHKAVFNDPLLDRAAMSLARMMENREGEIRILSGGEGLNSPSYEYLPIPELSGDRIYFTARNRDGRKNGEDIWLARRKTPPKNGAAPVYDSAPIAELNTRENEGPDAVSPDGTTLFMFGNYSGSRGQGDIFFSRLSKNGWESVKPLPAPINSPYFESDAFLTADGRAMLFASDRPGGYYPYQAKNLFYGGDWWGNTDLYISFINKDGTYSKPRNLGSLINTPGSERTPYLHPDGKTLYFASSGFAENSFGDMDVYKSVRLDDTWQNWSEPINVGTVVNGSDTDWGFRLTARADEGYFSGVQQNNQGGDDIYRVTPLPKNAQPAGQVAAIRGRILDQNGEPLQAELEWQDRITGEYLGTIQSRPDTGEFFIALPPGRSYAYYAKKDGYLSSSRNIDVPADGTEYVEESASFELIQVSAAQSSGTEITLSNINFATGSAKLTKDSVGELDRLLDLLKRNPILRIEIRGHTDNTGSRATNVSLSQKRAQSVFDYLVEQKIDKNRLRAKGFGPDKPIASNDTADGRRENRRVTFVVLGADE
ncbi:MAG: OmpA family protein [bacterium]|nr:OmpA family protein [bacterium]